MLVKISIMVLHNPVHSPDWMAALLGDRDMVRKKTTKKRAMKSQKKRNLLLICIGVAIISAGIFIVWKVCL